MRLSQKVESNPVELWSSHDRYDSSACTSGLMLWLAAVSVLSGIFDIKYYFHLQVRHTRSAHFLVGTFSFRPSL